jgi:hypothetical protein
MNTINAEEEETIIFFFFKHGGRRTTHTLPPLQLAALHVLPPHQRECRVHNQDARGGLHECGGGRQFSGLVVDKEAPNRGCSAYPLLSCLVLVKGVVGSLLSRRQLAQQPRLGWRIWQGNGEEQSFA